jgi:DNA-directed RNA polymerase specialized sigma24 family protein
MKRLPALVAQLPVRVRLAAAIEALPVNERTVLALRLVEGLSTLETAGALRLHTSTVTRLERAALRRLADECALRSAA